MSAPSISVVIPCLNEDRHLEDLLSDLKTQSRPCEVVVADGGSTDGSCDIARHQGATVLVSAPGRGQQLRAGADAAKGEILVFLHADCRLPDGALDSIARHLEATPDCPGGNFRLVFDGESGFSRWLTGFYAWIRRHGLYYGDSGVFVRRQVYHALGGIRPIALMEDFDFIRRLERAGPTCCISDPPLVTSSRRFENRHPLSIVLGWLLIHLLYYLGVSPGRLARIYKSAHHAPKAEARTL